jgi:hypothetical protein
VAELTTLFRGVSRLVCLLAMAVILGCQTKCALQQHRCADTCVCEGSAHSRAVIRNMQHAVMFSYTIQL